MDPVLRSTLLKFFLPLVGIAILLVVTRIKGIPWREGLGLRWPTWREAAGWMALWILWMALCEWVGIALGIEPPKKWSGYSQLVTLLRIAAIGFVGPILEELVVRGVLFFRLSQTRLGANGAIFVTAAVWSLVHVQYGWLTLLLIFLDGIFLGVVRKKTGSTILTIAMHVAGNLFSIYQSTS